MDSLLTDWNYDKYSNSIVILYFQRQYLTKYPFSKKWYLYLKQFPKFQSVITESIFFFTS